MRHIPMAPLPVLVAPGLWRLPTLGSSAVNSFVIENPDGTVALVDAGTRFAPRRVIGGLASIGKAPQDVSAIIVTHAHSDHVGGAATLRGRTGAPVHVHREDAAYVETGRRPTGTPSGIVARIFAHVATSMPECPVDATFDDGDLIDVGRGLRALHTPGHSPGHCSFLHEASGTLITGDALFNFRDTMSYSFAAFCFDPVMSRDTADRLGEPEYDVVAFTHGPEIRSGARDAVRKFLMRRVTRR